MSVAAHWGSVPHARAAWSGDAAATMRMILASEYRACPARASVARASTSRSSAATPPGSASIPSRARDARSTSPWSRLPPSLGELRIHNLPVGEATVDLLLRSHIWGEAHKGWPGLDGVSGFCVDGARAYLPSSARFNASTFTRGSPRNPNCRPSVCCSTSR